MDDGSGEQIYNSFRPLQIFITYEDMFGNYYSTVYEGYQESREFIWEQPQDLKPPNQTENNGPAGNAT